MLNQYLKRRKIYDDPSDDDNSDEEEYPQGFGAPPDESGDSDDSGDSSDSSPDNPFDDQNDDDPTSVTQTGEITKPASSFSDAFRNASEIPSGPAGQRLNAYLGKGTPQEKDFPVTKTNRLAAILGGASEGYQRGATAGVRLAKGIMDEPYQKGMQRYQMEGKNLETAAALEDKEMGRKASFARTAAITARDEATNHFRNASLQANVKRWEELNATNLQIASGRGYMHTIGANGHMYLVKPGSDTIDAGKVGQSTDEKTSTAMDIFGKQENIRQKNRVALENTKETNRETLEDQRSSGRIALRKIATNGKLRFIEVKGGNIMAFDPSDPEHPIDTGVATGTMNDKDKIEAGINGRIEVANVQLENALKKTAANPQVQNQEALLRMKNIFTKNGDKVKQYFNFDANGNPVSLKPGADDDEDYAKIQQYVMGKTKK